MNALFNISIEGVYMKNELCEYTSKTRNVLYADNKCDTLIPRTMQMIIASMEGNNDRYGRVAHGQGRGSTYQIHASLHQTKMPEWGIESRQNWWALEDQARGFARLRRQTSTRQKIKPPQRMATKFTAVRFLPSVSQAVGRNPWNNLPTFSIALLPNQSQWLCDMWAHERRCAHEK